MNKLRQEELRKEKENLSRELFMVEHGVSKEQAYNLSKYVRNDVESTVKFASELCTEEPAENPYETLMTRFAERNNELRNSLDERFHRVYDSMGMRDADHIRLKARVAELEKVKVYQGWLLFFIVLYIGTQGVLTLIDFFR